MSISWARVNDLVAEAVETGVTPSLTLAVGRGEDIIFELGRGTASATLASQGVSRTTPYDLSSLTKPLATTALLMQLCERGELAVGDPVARYLPEFATGDAARSSVTLRDLLTHSSGLPAHRKYSLRLDDERRAGAAAVKSRAARARVFEWAASEPLERPPNATALYSDVGFILLGRIVEVVTGRQLDDAFAEWIAAPLGVRDIGFVDLQREAPRFAREAPPCGHCPWRGRRIQAEVHDENAWAMGGVAGHAGLFGSLASVHALVADHVKAWHGERALVSAPTLRSFWHCAGAPGSTWAHGWDTPSAVDSSAGSRIGRPAFGHLGFTGTSVWIDLARGVHVVLLTNRLEAGGDNTRIRALRPLLHDAIFGALGSA